MRGVCRASHQRYIYCLHSTSVVTALTVTLPVIAPFTLVVAFRFDRSPLLMTLMWQSRFLSEVHSETFDQVTTAILNRCLKVLKSVLVAAIVDGSAIKLAHGRCLSCQ